MLDRDRLGHQDGKGGKDTNAVDVIGSCGKVAYGGPAYCNSHLFAFGGTDVLRDYALKDGRVGQRAQPLRFGKHRFRNPGAIPVASSNGLQDGIVWVVLSKGYFEHTVPAALQAYDAADIGRLLYTTGHSRWW